MLDFQKVKLKERVEAKKLFEGKSPEEFKAKLSKVDENMSEFEAEKRKQERIVMLQVHCLYAVESTLHNNYRKH